MSLQPAAPVWVVWTFSVAAKPASKVVRTSEMAVTEAPTIGIMPTPARSPLIGFELLEPPEPCESVEMAVVLLAWVS